MIRIVFLGLLCTFLTGISAVAQEAGKKPAPKLPYYPLDAVVDSQGTAYVVDRNMHGVWKWSEGKLTPLFEGSPKFRTPMNAARSIALDEKGTLLVGDSATRDIYRIDADGKAEPITGGEIGIPMDIAVKSDGTIYVADLELRMLMRIPAGSKKVEQVASVNPRGVFVDSKDQVWVVSQDKEQLLIVSDSGETEAIVDHRVFEFPHQVVVNSKGVAFVTDGYKKAVWKVTKGSEPEILFAGKPLDNPVGIALVDDQLIVVDPRAGKVFRFEEGKPTVWFEIVRE